jgi:hypothetical protein
MDEKAKRVDEMKMGWFDMIVGRVDERTAFWTSDTTSP